MRIYLSLAITWLFFAQNAMAQSTHDIITAVKKSQVVIETASYRLTRTDTLVTGHTRIITGKAVIEADTSNPVLQFRFWAKEDGMNHQMVFTGHTSYITNEKERMYKTSIKSEPIQLLNQSGGRIIMPDLFRLDTLKAVRIDLSSNKTRYFLKMVYADLEKYDVRNRYKLVEIDKIMMLPVAVRHHQETTGRVQDLHYKIEELQLNGDATTYDFTELPFLRTYMPETGEITSKHPFVQMPGRLAPAFDLESFENRQISLAASKGKVVLLDFWEVWCGPCIESMPKVQNLFDKYRSEGLLVYGITNDLKQLESAKRYIKKNKEFSFPFLIGNESVVKDYQLHSFPKYVLIDKSGIISFVSEGLSSELDGEIETALGRR